MPEVLDIEDSVALLSYLRQSGRIAAGEMPLICILQGGVSNRTVFVERPTGEAWVLKQALAKLRVPVDWFSPPERIHRESLGLQWLARLAPAGSVTPFVFEDPAHYLLCMQAVPKPHENWKSMLLQGRISSDHVRQFGELLARIHGEGCRRRGELEDEFGDRSFFESLRLEPYYGYSAQQAEGASAFLNQLIADTLARRFSLVHGDYSPKNILVHQGRLVLLDHEVIHFGDPAFDLGFSMTHFLSKAHHLPALRGEFAKAAHEYWRSYADALGAPEWPEPFAELEARVVRHTLACLLARAVGRSPLEYLDSVERIRQRDAVLRLMASPPIRVPGLIAAFQEELCRSSNA